MLLYYFRGNGNDGDSSDTGVHEKLVDSITVGDNWEWFESTSVDVLVRIIDNDFKSKNVSKIRCVT